MADHRQLIFARDTNGDDVADETTVVDADYARGGSPEHEPNGLLHGIDNWIYNAKSKFRYRFQNGAWVKQETEFRGQWGITQDDFGRLYYNYNWDQLRGDVVPPSYLNRNPNHKSVFGTNLAIAADQTVFPARTNTGVNRAYRPGVLDDRGRLREFTSASAPVVYRANHYPDEFHGNVFVCEPAANLIKRNIVADHGVALTARHAYPDREFVASTDERFRPVWTTVGPDGALYVADMYRGIIQHGQYMTSHLREEIVSRRLDSPIHMGRIYRVVQGRGATR